MEGPKETGPRTPRSVSTGEKTDADTEASTEDLQLQHDVEILPLEEVMNLD